MQALYAPCDHGFEVALAEELTALGLRDVAPGHRGVAFRGDRYDLWRATLQSRLANRVLLPLADFPAPTRADFYEGIRALPWPRIFRVDRTFALDASSHRSRQDHTGFIAQVAKDALCDRFRAETGLRPSVDRDHPDVAINIRLTEDHCTVSLDAAGPRLHRRGWRSATGEAPLKETLAAGMLRLIAWQPDQPLVDPMCGSGTFLVEAALQAADVAPGLLRLPTGRLDPHRPWDQAFAFERWADHDPTAFARLVAELRSRIRPARPTLVGFDHDLSVLAAARHNARRAGVEIRFEVGGLNTAHPPEGPAGCVITNPPYGQRLAADEALYRDLGDALKQRFPGWTAWVFAATEAPIAAIGLKPTRKIPLRNGPIECRLCRYDLYAGSRG